MSKRIIFVLVVFVYFLGFNLVKAEVIINEVQIGGASSSDEFIELYNSSSSAVDLTDWSIKKKSSSGVEYSLVSSTRIEGKSIAPNDYFLLVNENGYTGSISADATWASSNTIASNNVITLYDPTQTVISKVGWGSCTESCISDNPTDGQSIQKTSSGSWIIASPTPKAQNQDSGSGGNENTDDGNNDTEDNTTTTTSGSSSTTVKEIKPTAIPVFKANILASNLAFVGQPIEFNLDVKYGSDTYASGKYFWNFGDGTSKEEIVGFQKFTHVYYYPGEYNISLEYSKSNGSFTADATDEMTIKVVPLTVSISRVGDYKDFFIELTNNADYKIDISKWILSSNNKFFILPKNTTILGKKSMILPGKISGFIFGDQNNLKLSMPSGEVVFDYNTKSAPVKKAVEQINLDIENNISNTENKTSNTIQKETEIPTQNNLTASAVLSDTGNSKNQYLFIFGLVAFLGICGGAVYFLRRNGRVVDSVGDDFDILDE